MKKLTKVMAIVLTVVVMLQMLMSVSVFAMEYDDDLVAKNPKDARKAVAQIVMLFVDKNGKEHPLYAETGFFIDTSYVLTTYHGLHLTDEDLAYLSNPGPGGEDWMGEYFASHYKTDIIYRVYLNRDVNTKATLTSASSQKYDFGVLKVQDTLTGVSVLALGNNNMVDLNSEIYSLGFPSIVSGWEQGKENTFDDVTTTRGTITKLSTIEGTDMFQHDAKISSGNSGGPTINEEAAVVGLVKAVLGADSDYAYSIYINSITEVLDLFGIPYVKFLDEGGNGGSDTSDTSAEAETTEACQHQWETSTDKCTTITKCALCGEVQSEETTHTWGEWTAFKDEGVQKKQCTVCGEFAPETQPIEGPNWILIIAIIAAVLVAAIIAAIVVLATKGKKTAAPAPMAPNNFGAPAGRPQPAPTPMGAPMGAPMAPPAAPQPPKAPAYTAPANVGGGETTVLSAGAGETTVLGASGAGSTCAIIRAKNGERIPVTAGEFVIGKEQRRVNYCISNNNSISRAHAKIVTKGGEHFIVDLNSTNCTFVNGLKIAANTEQALKDGDKIKLADEEFEFKA